MIRSSLESLTEGRLHSAEPLEYGFGTPTRASRDWRQSHTNGTCHSSAAPRLRIHHAARFVVDAADRYLPRARRLRRLRNMGRASGKSLRVRTVSLAFLFTAAL